MKQSDPVRVPADRRARSPLITEAGYALLKGILEHPDAPRWNYEVGDRVVAEDLRAVNALRRRLSGPRAQGTGAPPLSILRWVRRMRPLVPSFRARIPQRFDLRSRWAGIPTVWREDLALRLADMVPDGADLSRLIVYDTSGATGHAIRVPHHPRTIAENHAFLEYVLARHGVRTDFRPGETACINVGAQADTVVFATTFSVWNQAGFVKVNLHPRAWDPASARRFFADLSPRILTGDPIGFTEMIAWRIRVKPAALVSTAVLLEPAVEERLSAYFGCPVIDSYAMTETGPIAYANPEHEGLCVLPQDVYVEIVDAEGRPVPEGERGEICVTGGRNPYLPLLRYRTGDFARMAWSRTVASDPAPRILDLRARAPVRFRAADGSPVSPVDIGRVLRLWSFVQHEFVQRRDGSCAVALRPVPGCPVDTGGMASRLRRLFGRGIRVAVRLDPALGAEGKVLPFRAES